MGSLDPAPFFHTQGGTLGGKKGLVSTVCTCAGFQQFCWNSKTTPDIPGYFRHNYRAG